MLRRDFLRYAAAAGMAVALPALFPGRLLANEPRRAAAARMDWNRILVLIELKGGNDGLNTVVPYADQEYYRLRPNLAVEADRVLRVTPQLGFHPNFQPLMTAWQQQEMAVVLGTGYQRPNRSHFRGIDIWHGGSESNEIARDGWLARLLDDARGGQVPEDLLAHSVIWGNENAVSHAGLGPLVGRAIDNLVMNRADDFVNRARQFAVPTDSPLNAAHAHIIKSQTDLVRAAGRLQQAMAVGRDPAGDWPRHHFSQHMQQTARLINGGAVVPVYKLTLDGFDTHANQVRTHEMLLDVFARSVAALREACIKAGTWHKVLVMTYSEFGRRVAGNDSHGTDHGAAAPQFILGGKVRGGFYGSQPPCSRLQIGDIPFNVDFRQLYTTVAQEWWGYRGDFLRQPNRFKTLGLIR